MTCSKHNRCHCGSGKMLKNCCKLPKPKKNKPKPLPHRIENQCGECTACCTVMGVEELGKPFHQTCKHVCANGCAIYQDRPASCRVWECSWRSGWISGGEKMRPDRLGVMFEWRIIGGNSFLIAYEVWPGALELLQVKRVLDHYQGNEVVVCVKHGMTSDSKLELVAGSSDVLDFLRDNYGKNDYPILPEFEIVDGNGVKRRGVARRVGDHFELELSA
jgi:hypothetical protein